MRRLEAATGAVRLSADEWYMRLYVGEGSTPHLDRAAWQRLMSALEELWPALLERGVDVILDFGFCGPRAARDRARPLADGAGATVRLYEVICDESVARRRFLARNDRPDGSFQVDLRSVLDLVRSGLRPEAPTRSYAVLHGWSAR